MEIRAAAVGNGFPELIHRASPLEIRSARSGSEFRVLLRPTWALEIRPRHHRPVFFHFRIAHSHLYMTACPGCQTNQPARTRCKSSGINTFVPAHATSCADGTTWRQGSAPPPSPPGNAETSWPSQPATRSRQLGAKPTEPATFLWQDANAKRLKRHRRRHTPVVHPECKANEKATGLLARSRSNSPARQVCRPSRDFLP